MPHPRAARRDPAATQPGRAQRRFHRRVPDGSAPLIHESTPPPALRGRHRAFRIALVLADVAAAILVTAETRLVVQQHEPWWTIFLLPLLLPAVQVLAGGYERDARLISKSTLDEVPALFNTVTLVAVVVYLTAGAWLGVPIGTKELAVMWLGLALAVPASRAVARGLLLRALPPERCLVVGDRDQAHRVARRLMSEEAGLDVLVVGVLARDDGGVLGQLSPSDFAGVLGEEVAASDVHRVVIAGDASTAESELETIQAAKALGVDVTVVPRLLEVVGHSATHSFVDGLAVLGVPRFGLSPRARLAKRAFDVAGSALALLVLAPIMAFIALQVKLGSPGPVIFEQIRIGRDGRPFAMLKFRSMYRDADRMKDTLRNRNEADGLFKITDDPRVTRIGRLLRRMSLDELPQLLNVLRGEMSLVGPRPLVPDEDRKIHGYHRRRLDLQPGMTGPWQVLGSSRIPLREMMTIDYLYVADWSIWEDAKIFLRTIGAVVGGRGR